MGYAVFGFSKHSFDWQNVATVIIFTEEDSDAALESEEVGVEKLSGLNRWDRGAMWSRAAGYCRIFSLQRMHRIVHI